MHLLFESRRNLTAFKGRLRFTQHQPRIHPEPVLLPDTAADGSGAAIYGTVLQASGRFRMWYQAIPRQYDHAADVSSVAHAESDDGIHWHKPQLGLIKRGEADSHLTTLGLHAPAIFVDPAAPAEKKFAATGCLKPHHPLVKQGHAPGIYTTYSSDGLQWNLDSKPHWPFTGDVSSSVYHPGRKETLVAIKYMPRRNGLIRRSIMTATLNDGQPSPTIPALVPDEAADLAAIQRGCVSADYYGMGMLPAAGTSTVGFLWNYWHTLPYSPGPSGNGPVGLYGNADISLVYQEETGSLWQHMPGRQAFIERKDIPWRTEWLYSASSAVLVGDEHRLYFTTFPFSHGRQLREDWTPDPKLVEELKHEGYAKIAMASWPKWRLFGLFADPHGSVVLNLNTLTEPCRLQLNYRCGKSGQVRVAVVNDADRSLEQVNALSGDATSETVTWKTSDIIKPGQNVQLELELHDASVYAYQLVPAN